MLSHSKYLDIISCLTKNGFINNKLSNFNDSTNRLVDHVKWVSLSCSHSAHVVPPFFGSSSHFHAELEITIGITSRMAGKWKKVEYHVSDLAEPSLKGTLSKLHELSSSVFKLVTKCCLAVRMTKSFWWTVSDCCLTVLPVTVCILFLVHTDPIS